APLIDGKPLDGETQANRNPAHRDEVVGEVVKTDPRVVEAAIGSAVKAQVDWNLVRPSERAAILLRAADAYEKHMPELAAYCIREAGRSVVDSIAE
ncbi:aldehyde dehydrogenase family protein, partial [Salmonella enterica]|uniref:aldehyde dehydrogenase family protein n=1 Tax=Salmonella enterica TaxID=28901 RepID=UPI00329771E7